MQTTVLKTLWDALAQAVGRNCLIVHPVWGEASHSFNRYLLSTINAPGIVQATMARAAKETDGVPTAEASGGVRCLSYHHQASEGRGWLRTWAAHDRIPQGPRLGLQSPHHLSAFAQSIPSA